MKLLVSCVLGLSLLASRGALAGELMGTGPLAGATVQFNEDFELRYYQSSRELPGFEDRAIHDYIEQVNRLNGLLNQRTGDGGMFSAGFQLDQVALFSNRYILDGEMMRSWDLLSSSVDSPFEDGLVEIEKLFLSTRSRRIELTLGDGYASFGRGIALNMKKNTDIDLDTSIRGARAMVRVDRTDLTVVSGITNAQQISQDQPNLGIERDLSNMVTGLRVEQHEVGPLTLGAHGVAYRFGRTEDAGIDRWARYGEDIDALVGGVSAEGFGLLGLDLYAEADLFRYLSPVFYGAREDEEYQPRTGHVAYLSASAYPGLAVVQVEAKHSKDSERINTFVSAGGWEVATVPSMEYERVITEDSAAALNSDSIYGGRVRVDYSAAGGTVVPYLSMMGLRDTGDGPLHFNESPETIVHPVGGIQVTDSAVTGLLNAGLRMDIRDDSGEGRDQLIHLDGDISVPLGAHDHVDLAVAAKHFSWGDNVQDQADFTEMENALAWHRGEKLVFVFYQDYGDNPLAQSTGNLSEKLYGALEATWKPRTDLALRAFYGAYKAGIRCSGGQCRSLPGFEGARVAVTGSF